ncbi:MAG: ribonuclease P protein component [Sulfuritalea sp.]|nr:ribonuclease P protein component [Sulfuritalea sp.]MBK8760210.1 ribonuclease P protein component [Sulfuritalea sp.]MBK9352170.1 ribonuclease P protein component [Sulfuritalea sp.]
MRVAPRAVIVSASKLRARFQKGSRLHQPREFAAVLSARKVLRGDSFDLHMLATENAGAPRLGLIVPKRLARAANLRNAIKRQAREAFRLMIARCLPCDVVLRLKRPVSVAGNELRQQLRSWRGEIDRLLGRLPARGA